MVEGDPQLDALDHATLDPLVKRALNHEKAEPIE